MSQTCGFCLGNENMRYTAAHFAEAFRKITGDGVCRMGGKLALTIHGFSVEISTGYALANGYWLGNNLPFLLEFSASGNNRDRVDAVAIRVDSQTDRKTSLEILEDYDPFENLEDGVYILPLYLIRVKRGAVNLYQEDVTDVRNYVIPLSKLSAGALRVYDFFASGIEAEISRLIEMSKRILSNAETAVSKLKSEIQQKDGTTLGDLLTSRNPPLPSSHWILCSGGAVPSSYPKLHTMLSGVLPNLSKASDRYKHIFMVEILHRKGNQNA